MTFAKVAWLQAIDSEDDRYKFQSIEAHEKLLNPRKNPARSKMLKIKRMWRSMMGSRVLSIRQ